MGCKYTGLEYTCIFYLIRVLLLSDCENQPSAPIIDEADEWPSIKEVRGEVQL